MKLVIDTKYDDTCTATSKAREDVNRILTKQGYSVKYINIKKVKNNLDLFKNIRYSYKQLKEILDSIPEKSYIVFQYPFDSLSYKFSTIIKKTNIKKNLKTVVLIHDLNSIRTASKFGKIYYDKYVREIKFLDNFDRIICHNDKMKDYLTSNGIKSSKITNIELFDYLVDTKTKAGQKEEPEYKKVIIAGNLSEQKAGFVYKLSELKYKSYSYYLYGVNYTGKTSKKVNYKGSFKSSEPNKSLKSGFGLVWDGSSYDKCDGNFGNYLMYNNPHKLSLYVACGLPVIVWKKSALAKFVIDNKIGIAIDSLEELDNYFAKLSEKEYKNYCKEVEKIQKKVLNGEFLIQAIKKVGV